MTDITLLDGGLGQELVKRSATAPTPLWSTRVMMDRPGLVAEVHRDYFNAGATIATTNSYAIHRDRLAKEGLADQLETLHAAALTEAKSARDAFGTGRIAGSIGPLGASYRADLHPEPDVAVSLVREIATLLAPQCDLLILETVASLAQARDGLAATTDLGLPVWLALTVDDEDGARLRSGEALADVLSLLQGRAAAILANCSAPEAMPAALDILGKANLPFGAYANAFTQITKAFLKDSPTVDALNARRDMTPETYADHAMGWVAQGATIVGGCCETDPTHIAEIARRLTDAGHRIV